MAQLKDTGPGLFSSYEVGAFYDEMFGPDGAPRRLYDALCTRMMRFPQGDLPRRQQAADRVLLDLGITFNLYGEKATRERPFPFDIVPRIVDAAEWGWIERGLQQRIVALNAFVDDVYHEQKILRDGAVPRDVVASARMFRPQCVGLNPPRGVWCHIVGTDLVRDADGRVYVLEDNLRCPSGVSYVLKNREVMKRIFPQIFERIAIRPVDDYGSRLLDLLTWVAPAAPGCRIAVLTPGIHNSAYFEHAFLAQAMGVDLVEGHDLVVVDGYVHVQTTRGLERVDVLYRRIDDDFLDPRAFRPDSLLGVPGVFEAYRAGRVALVNAPGTGVADDKVVYAYVPDMIRYYLGEDPLLPNVPTYVCADPKQLAHVLDHLDELVVKPANESGGYGMLIGPAASKAERETFRARIAADPRNYVAQPTLSLSRVPVLVDGRLEGRHVDLRPFVLLGREPWVLPGGLSRVALRKGSLVVNSSQGGGSKDTWVLA